MVSERHVSRSKATDVSGLDIPTRRPFIAQPLHLLEFPNLTVKMAPRGSIRGASLPEPGSDQGLDLTLSLSVGGAGRKRAAEMEVVKEGRMQVKKQRKKCEAEREGGIVGGVSGAGWFMSEYGCHAQLEKSVPVGTGTMRSTSVVSDRDSGYLIGGSGTNSDSSTTTTTEQSKLNSHLSTHTTQYITKPTHQNPNPNRIFPKMPHMPFVAVKAKEPNTPSITGFLYRVTETAEVFIVCACHGTFFSPTGFVEHAGWTNVINPLRHIVVRPY